MCIHRVIENNFNSQFKAVLVLFPYKPQFMVMSLEIAQYTSLHHRKGGGRSEQ